MRTTRLGTVLLFLGLAVGVVAGGALLLDFRPSRLPAALLDLVAYKLAFIAALGLIAAGAIVRRGARRRRAMRRDAPNPIAPGELPAPPAWNGTAPGAARAKPSHTPGER
jgi:hypothetical protein